MIKSFADRRTQEIYLTGTAPRLPPDIATRLDDLKVPSGNRLHALRGNRRGQYAIAINDQWRICFRFKNGNAYDVEVCDYH